MAFNVKEDWPLLAAGLVAVAAVIWILRPKTTQTQIPVAVGGQSAANAATTQAAIQASAQSDAARQQTFATVFGTYVNALTRREEVRTTERVAQIEGNLRLRETEASERIGLAQASAQRGAAEAQARAQSQASLFGLLGTVATGIFGLFCRETTAGRLADVRAANNRQLRRSTYERALSQSGVWRMPGVRTQVA